MSAVNQFLFQAAVANFRQARQQAALQEVLARLRGKSNDLLSFEQVAERLHCAGQTERGIQSIALDRIVGSVGRYTDFTRTFLPRGAVDAGRWARVRSAVTDSDGLAALPPIEVYQIGDCYFVLDGNHRVSVARQSGAMYIEAHVIEVQSPVPLTPDVSPDALIVKAECAQFLRESGLAAARPGADLSLTVPGRYRELYAQIQLEKERLEQKEGHEIRFTDAAVFWYDEVYCPFVEAIRERGLLRLFPGRTEADLYLWVFEHRAELEKNLGWAIRPGAAVADLAIQRSSKAGGAEKEIGHWRRARLVERYSEHLFQDILAPISDEPEDWGAVSHAIDLARREGARLHGLHVVPSDAAREDDEHLALKARFEHDCAAACVGGHLAIETGRPVAKICERARLADLVVLSASHPPPVGVPSLSSGLRQIIWNSSRPVLAVHGPARGFRRGLAMFDGSPKAKEALFVAAYFGETYSTELIVAVLEDGPRAPASVLDYAREYLDLHSIRAEYQVVHGRLDAIVRFIREREIDLVFLGGYSVSAVEEVVGGGSAVNTLLRESPCPLFICR